MNEKALILLVDDDVFNLKKAQEILLKENYKVAVAKSGLQALHFLERNVPDLVLLDINMPEMNGFQLMEEIRKNPEFENLPIVFLTADSDSETETKCLELGAYDFITKPFVAAVMCSRIDRILELEKLRKNLATSLNQKIREISDMRSKSYQDALTGLWNRAYSENAVNETLNEGIKGALLMIDMDDFKSINDKYGHVAGDRTLIIFSQIMQKYAKEGDVLCRIGGDEFIVFIKGETHKAIVAARAAKMISEICEKIVECGFETNTSVSIGIAQAPEDGTDFATLYNAADKALYHVKQNGKNAYHFYSDQSAIERVRNAHNVDVEYIRDIMRRSDAGLGSYLMDYDNFHHVYNFIRRIVKRSGREVQTILYTLIPESANENIEELALASDMLEQAIFTSLRRVDVSTHYSSSQMIVLLMDSNLENGKLVAERIIDYFYSLYAGNVQIEYSIVRMEDY